MQNSNYENFSGELLQNLRPGDSIIIHRYKNAGRTKHAGVMGFSDGDDRGLKRILGYVDTTKETYALAIVISSEKWLGKHEREYYKLFLIDGDVLFEDAVATSFRVVKVR